MLTISLGALTSAAALADSYAALAGSGDTWTLNPGETALVMAGAGTFTYAKQGKPCAFIRLSEDKKSTLRQTSLEPIPLVGPCKITVRSTDGYLGMKLVSTGIRRGITKTRVATIPKKNPVARR